MWRFLPLGVVSTALYEVLDVEDASEVTGAVEEMSLASFIHVIHIADCFGRSVLKRWEINT